MKVLIVNNMAPFIWGGAEELAVNLERNLIKAGHEAEVLRIPFQWEPSEAILSQMLMVRSFKLMNADKVIALKFPAYLVEHENKTLWLLHQYRQAYDLYDTGHTNVKSETLRNRIIGADNQAFIGSRNIFTNSEVTQARLKKYNGFESAVLLPPVNDPFNFQGGDFSGYIFAGGRVNSMKRQFMLVEAMQYVNKDIKLVVAGPPESESDRVMLEKMVEDFDLHDRVKLDLRFLERSEYASYVNNASAIAYLPVDEDSLGYVAMEAATAGKPIITTSDSGGILGIAKHEITGWVSNATPLELARVMNNATTKHAKVLGNSARELWTSMNVTWEKTLEALLK